MKLVLGFKNYYVSLYKISLKTLEFSNRLYVKMYPKQILQL